MMMFKLPFGRCLSPQPYPEKPAFKKGDLVCWAPDHEQGVVMAADEERVTVAWEESQSCTYSTSSLAARENIVAFENSEGEPV
jgi:hypothetical protein